MVLDVTAWEAFIAGILSFASPCVLPLVPPYLCYLGGMSMEALAGDGAENTAAGTSAATSGAAGTAGRRHLPRIHPRVVAASGFFVLGFMAVFVALGATASAVGQALSQYLDVLSIIAGILIAIMGLHFLGVFRLFLLYREARIHISSRPAGMGGAFVMGLAFAFGWTPCVGPVLAAILFVAGAEDSVSQGMALLALYALGIGIPFMIAALFAGPFMGWMRRFRRHLGRIEKVMGALLVATGVLFMTNQMSEIAFWLLEIFPALGKVG